MQQNHQMLSRRQPFAEQGEVLGFEILGREHGGSFHSSVCHGLELDYQQMLGLSLNAHGLFSRYEEAKQAEEFTNLESTGAESVPWAPWLIAEIPLIAQSESE